MNNLFLRMAKIFPMSLWLLPENDDRFPLDEDAGESGSWTTSISLSVLLDRQRSIMIRGNTVVCWAMR